ncbi:MAG TPA: ParB/RepB/Spo0J family partition protein [Longilinea sp.]|nr:ParB/RepB/Spo0J family partition protein [Longilinea sp.]
MSPKGGLGKGLDALIPGGFSAQPESGTLMVSTERIVPNPHQPRTFMDDTELEELANSIREHGVLQPLIVSYDPSTDIYTLIAGERRLRASKLAGLEMVPVILHSATDQQRLELALIENVQRADLSPLETAEAYRQLAEDFKLSHDEISQQVGKSRVAVTNTLRLLKLPDSARIALAEGKITEGHARALLALSSVQSQAAALQTILRMSLSVRQTEDLVRKLSGEKPDRPVKSAPPADIQALESRLRDHLGTRVTLHHGKKGGTLTLHYFSEEELESLIRQLMRE